MVIAQNLQKIDPKSDGAKRDWVAIYDECANVLYQEIDYNKEAANTELFARYRVAAKLGKGQSVKSLQGDYVAWKGVVPTVGAGLKSIWDAAVVFLVDGYGDRSHNFSMLSLLLPVVLLFAVVVNLVLAVCFRLQKVDVYKYDPWIYQGSSCLDPVPASTNSPEKLPRCYHRSKRRLLISQAIIRVPFTHLGFYITLQFLFDTLKDLTTSCHWAYHLLGLPERNRTTSLVEATLMPQTYRNIMVAQKAAKKVYIRGSGKLDQCQPVKYSVNVKQDAQLVGGCGSYHLSTDKQDVQQLDLSHRVYGSVNM
ncbi:hypothetical protein L6452_15676 [Arctium lappa]|uniref:Uncharacterized protein n=1 Tax=Arctium lappa TaxID=4217 RepID=A0ACB9CPC5_ARCLA|nr:hypothetical protein L6452_15676 [Arctium lappa]